MPNIFDYTDYKKFLADHYAEAKRCNPNYSYKLMANKAGFKNKGFVFNLINGKKHLSKTHVLQLCKVLELNQYEAEYFGNLVEFNQARTFSERNFYYNKLEEIKYAGKRISPVQVLRKDQYEFYSQWYHSVIRLLINDHPFTGDYHWLAKQVNPNIRPMQAKKSVQLLERIGLVVRHPDGVYRTTSKTLTTGPEVADLGVANFHLETMRLASRALQTETSDRRNITGVTLGISKETYKKICGDIQEFQGRLLKLAEMDEKADRIYRINFHMFPMTKIKKGNASHES